LGLTWPAGTQSSHPARIGNLFLNSDQSAPNRSVSRDRNNLDSSAQQK
jgi:hypothetical protein